MIKIEGLRGFYDLSSGYLGEDAIGHYIKTPIYSAEKFLMDIECLCMIKNLTVKVEAYDLEESEVKMEAKI
jgi:hypothetical protein